MRPCDEEIVLAPNADALEALTRMQRGNHGRMLVVENRRLLGVLVLSDMLQFLALKRELETGPWERHLWGTPGDARRPAH